MKGESAAFFDFIQFIRLISKSVVYCFFLPGGFIILEHHRSSHLPFEDSERRNWQNPEAVLTGIGLKPGFTFADIGCGGGFFALPAARIVGKSGQVYGLDANADLIAFLKERAAGEGLKNLHLTVGRAEETVVCEQCADIVFFGMALHDFQDASLVLKNARRMVKTGGRLVNLDWKKEPMELGPPLKIRFDVAKAVDLIKAAGFTVEAVRDGGRYHYLVIARP
jgi:ubiquinone/menaquinone biosynthesis C-methylase UbiE